MMMLMMTVTSICCPQRSIELIENRVNMGQDNEQTLIKDHGTLVLYSFYIFVLLYVAIVNEYMNGMNESMIE